MKKKFAFLFVLVLIFPLLALFGCDEAVYFKFYAYASCDNGFTNAPKEVKQGSTVKLTAIAKEGNYFIGWIFHDKILKNDNIYKVTDQTVNQNDQVTKSELSFTSSQGTEGDYYAIFSEDSSTMQYIKYEGATLSTSENAVADSNNVTFADGSTSFGSASLTLYKGTMDSTTIYSNETIYFREKSEVVDTQTTVTALKINADEIYDIIYLDPDEMQHIHLVLTMEYQFDLRAGLLMKQNDEKWNTEDSNFSYKVNFLTNEGRYKVSFKFNNHAEGEENKDLYLSLYFTVLK